MYEYSFEKLDAWKEARILIMQIYKSTKRFPADERFGLINQIRRAAISIASNVAEGSGRRTSKDQSHFYNIAYSSTLELLNQWIISKDLEFINEPEFLIVRKQIEIVTIRIHRLRTVILSNSQTSKPSNFQTLNPQTSKPKQ
jgi:four helix bundle protein